jgi:hypothetical protein
MALNYGDYMKKISSFIVINLLYMSDMSAASAEINIDFNAKAKIGGKVENLRGNTRSDENNSAITTGNNIRLDLKYSVSKTPPNLINLKVKTYKKVSGKFILWDTSKVSALSGHDVSLKMSKGKDWVEVLIIPSIL